MAWLSPKRLLKNRMLIHLSKGQTCTEGFEPADLGQNMLCLPELTLCWGEIKLSTSKATGQVKRWKNAADNSVSAVSD